MKLIIEIPHGASLALDSNAAQLVPAIMGAQLVYRRGYGSDTKYDDATEGQIEVRVARDEQFTATPEPIEKLQAANAEANSRWYAEYTAHAATKKRMAELQAQLDAAKTAVAG